MFIFYSIALVTIIILNCLKKKKKKKKRGGVSKNLIGSVTLLSLSCHQVVKYQHYIFKIKF